MATLDFGPANITSKIRDTFRDNGCCIDGTRYLWILLLLFLLLIVFHRRERAAFIFFPKRHASTETRICGLCNRNGRTKFVRDRRARVDRRHWMTLRGYDRPNNGGKFECSSFAGNRSATITSSSWTRNCDNFVRFPGEWIDQSIQSPWRCVSLVFILFLQIYSLERACTRRAFDRLNFIDKSPWIGLISDWRPTQTNLIGKWNSPIEPFALLLFHGALHSSVFVLFPLRVYKHKALE